MLGGLIRKEIAHHLLDYRFVAVFALCALLSALGVYVGTENYLAQRHEHDTASEARRQWIQGLIDNGNARNIGVYGYHWGRPPEVLSPFVYGLSGTFGREVGLHYRPLTVRQGLPFFQSSPLELNPALRLFGILDLAFIVKIVLSLAVLLFTYDAVCGEKEEGTLRLTCSFPVSRSVFAAAKMIGSTLAVLLPFIFSFLLACAVMVLTPDFALKEGDWVRIGGIMLVFVLYLSVFAGFGLWASSLTHRRLVAFLGLLGLWSVWLYLIPNTAVRIGEWIQPVDSIYALEAERDRMRYEVAGDQAKARTEYYRATVPDYDGPTAYKEGVWWSDRFQGPTWEIIWKHNERYGSRLLGLYSKWRRQMDARLRAVRLLSALSPLGATDFLTTDLARTGFGKDGRIQRAIISYLPGFQRYLWEKTSAGEGPLTDFERFTFRDREPVIDVLFSNVFSILNLALLAVLGFAGAFFSLLRYDVR